MINIYDINQANFYINKGCIVREFGYNPNKKSSYVSFELEDTRQHYGEWLTRCKEKWNIETNPIWSVYKHTNKTNGKVYIGITSVNPEQRWNNGEGYKNQEFYYAIEKYTWDGFEHEILFERLTKSEAEAKEIELISTYDSTSPKFGYNRHKGGNVLAIGKDNHNSRQVVCDGIVFDSIRECATFYGIEPSTMSNWLNQTSQMRGDFKEMRLAYTSYYKKDLSNTKIVRKTICENIEYNSAKECSLYYGVNVATMRDWLSGKTPMPKEWYDKGLRYFDKEMSEYKFQIPPITSKIVICDNNEYYSISTCAKHYNESRRSMSSWLSGDCKMPKKYQELGLRFK